MFVNLGVHILHWFAASNTDTKYIVYIDLKVNKKGSQWDFFSLFPAIDVRRKVISQNHVSEIVFVSRLKSSNMCYIRIHCYNSQF